MPVTEINIAITKLESHLENYTIANSKISKSNIAWHIDHSLKVINNVIIALQESKPETFKNNFSFLGKIFFTLGFFPRGKAKAPKQVLPPETILKENIILQFQSAKANIKILNTLNKNAYFKHPFFGNVNMARIPRFLVLHTNHHLKIINAILKP